MITSLGMRKKGKRCHSNSPNLKVNCEKRTLIKPNESIPSLFFIKPNSTKSFPYIEPHLLISCTKDWVQPIAKNSFLT